MAGGVTVPIYGSNTAEQCEFIVRDAGAKLVIVEDDGQREKIGVDPRAPADGERGRSRLPAIPRGSRRRPWTSCGRRGAKRWGRDPALLANRGEPGPDSLFTIVYTSGTTGTPKGVVLTHDNLVASMCSGGRAMNVGDNDEQYLFLPLAHILGREMVWAGFELGYTTAFSRGHDADSRGPAGRAADVHGRRAADLREVLRGRDGRDEAGIAARSSASPPGRSTAAGRTRPPCAPGAGAGASAHWLADKIVLSKLRARLGLDRCRFLISGGAPLAPEIAEFFHAAGLLILEGYGLTETTSAVFLNTPERFRFGTVGPALDVVESRIAEDGEILVRGAPVFRQYYNNAEATAEAVEPDGWFHTGDIGVFEDGFLRITDRKKDLIVTAGGKKVAPQPLESALKAATPLVAQVLVYGDKRPYCVALVTPSEVALKQFGARRGRLTRAEGGHPEGAGRA